MSLRINHNTRSLNAHRSLVENSDRLGKSLEKLSSGMTINRAGDGPSTLVASEQMRSQIAGLDQAIKNSETSVSMIQTAEGALSEVNSMLVGMRQLAIHAANEGANDDVMLAADQLEIDAIVDAIDRVATTTEFGKRKLLDGSNGVSGTAIGQGLEYVSATTDTMSSGEKGFDITIDQAASKASLAGGAITLEQVQAGEELTVVEGGRTAKYMTKESDTVESAIQNFSRAAKDAGLNIEISNSNGAIQIAHKQYGSEYSFDVASTTVGILSSTAGTLRNSGSGADLKGKIGGEAAIGRGNTMTGIAGNPSTDGLSVSFTAQPGQAVAAGTVVGSVSVSQNALTFQIGANRGQTVDVALQNMSGSNLGRGIENASGFTSLKTIDVTTSQGAQDAMKLVDAAVNRVSQTRAELGSFQKNTLESNIANLRTSQENMVAAESTIRDADMALEMAEYTRNDLMTQSASAMLANASRAPGKVMSLLLD